MPGTTREATTTLAGYDPFDPAVIADPFPYYRLLQQDAPVYEVEKYGFFVLSRYDDVVAAAQDWEHFSTTWGPGPQRVEAPVASILQSDPPQHTRLRSIISKAFTPRAVAACEPLVDTYAHECVDTILEQGKADLIDEYAIPIPVVVIAELLGVPREDRALFRKWSDDIVAAIGGKVDPRNSQREFNAYFSDVVEARQKEPRDDVISKLLRPNAKGEMLDTPEVISFCLSLLVAGNETTTGLIGNLFFELARRPEAWRRLREDPSLVASAVEESLRFDAPNQGLFRHTVKEVDLHGVRIPADRKVLLLFGAAGRDSDHFEKPDEFDIARTPNRHIAFGAGIHHCLGASLGRLEANTALRIATERIEEIRLVDETPPYIPVFFIRCPEHYRVHSTPSSD
ncbi:MAG: cytochrome P450 [Myxococcota bacterium]|nr:cytochrome P450 [Myxococcota bacterium]